MVPLNNQPADLPQSQQVANIIIHAVQQNYLQKHIKIVSSDRGKLKQFFSSVANFSDAKKKISKTSENLKVHAASVLVEEIQKIAFDTNLDDIKKVEKMMLLLDDMIKKFDGDTGDFANILQYAKSVVQGVIAPPPLTILSRDDPQRNAVEQKVAADVLAKRERAMFLEPARILKKASTHARLKFILREIRTGAPKFGGEEEFIFIQKIESIDNPELKKRYEEEKNKLRDELSKRANIHNPSFGLSIPGISDQLDSSVGEVLLYHGTSLGVSHFIANTGFQSKFCGFHPARGYGPLGKGTYFSDELSKSGTYASCAVCGAHHCHCKTEKGVPVPKVFFISKVLLGNPSIITKKTKNNMMREKPPEDYHSMIGVGQTQQKGSEFRSNEFSIANDAQTYPQYRVYFHHYKNYLVPKVWQREMKKLAIQYKGDKKLLEDLTQLIKENYLVMCESNNIEVKMKSLLKVINLIGLHQRNHSLPEGLNHIYSIIKLEAETMLTRYNDQLLFYQPNLLSPQQLSTLNEEYKHSLKQMENVYSDPVQKNALFYMANKLSKQDLVEFIDVYMEWASHPTPETFEKIYKEYIDINSKKKLSISAKTRKNIEIFYHSMEDDVNKTIGYKYLTEVAQEVAHVLKTNVQEHKDFSIVQANFKDQQETIENMKINLEKIYNHYLVKDNTSTRAYILNITQMALNKLKDEHVSFETVQTVMNELYKAAYGGHTEKHLKHMRNATHDKYFHTHVQKISKFYNEFKELNQSLDDLNQQQVASARKRM